ncbi:DnaJ domain-containing protein [Mrakia frigida]|uniref:DnaJ domain-containing protein n=1 Tax=Mrakia frigida TaxID=29902 RepID=UPI003FCC2465
MSVPNYYAILSVPTKATFEEIRAAYRKESLKSHPDRLPPDATTAERKRATSRFQQVADAYFTLSDPVRRREYDLHLPSAYSSSSYQDDDTENPFASGPPPTSSAPPPTSASSFFSNLFSGTSTPGDHADADETFTNVFSDLLEPELGRESHSRIWSIVGGGGGLALGFVVGNVPGALAGAFAGNRLGAIRDAKGKSVGEVFLGLGTDRKAQILRALAAKVFSTVGQHI